MPEPVAACVNEPGQVRHCELREIVELPPPEAVRVEEFVNFFDYAYPPPAADAFAIYADGAPSPLALLTSSIALD